MPNTDTDSPFFPAFFDDYSAECDEHLTAVQRGLLTLEGHVGQPRVDRSLIDELLRSFHTIKGLSGMVGLAEAELLAHHLESYLRSLHQQGVPPDADGLEALAEGTRALEQVIAARRAGHPVPDPARSIQRLMSRVPPAAAPPQNGPAAGLLLPPVEGPAATQAAQAQGEGLPVWRFVFVPAAALAARGVTVNAVRDRIRAVGQLLQATPRVGAGSGVAFDFLVATAAPECTFAGWEADGLTWARYEPLAPGAVEPEPVPAVTAPSLTPANVVRVDLTRLDELMRLAGDLVISRSRLDDTIRRIQSVVPPDQWRLLQEANQGMERQLRSLREGVMRVRLVPIGDVFTRMQFVVRDLARESGKKIVLTLHGQETQIDKYIVERMTDPLLHLIRNAISHGLEPPAERLAQGKPAEGTVTLRARAAGETVVLEVEDDGRGIDSEQVAARGRELGLIEGDGPLDSNSLLEVLCRPGFSTRQRADRVSGRGVGMDVVRTAVHELGGTLMLATEWGRGTRFTMALPLTLVIADALVVVIGNQTFAVPQAAIHEVFQLQPDAQTRLENNEILAYRGGVLPLLRLAKLFGLADSPGGPHFVLVAGAEGKRSGLVVDRILGQREIVVRALADPLVRVAGISGATELGNGQVVLILDATTLARSGRQTGRGLNEGSAGTAHIMRT